MSLPLSPDPRPRRPSEVVAVPLPTSLGTFHLRAFACASGWVYLALVMGEVDDHEGVLTRLHSECLTGDVLGSLRCDCGVQLRTALRAVAAEGRGIVLYLTGQEGRGAGLVNKLRAYVEQDRGADTVEANLRLGLPADARDYGDAAAVLEALGVRSIRLLTNNPDKVSGLRQVGIVVDAVEPIATAAHSRNRSYLRTKERRFGHVRPVGGDPGPLPGLPIDVSTLIGRVRPRTDRPYVVVSFAQTVDGRIATASGDSKWISCEEERRVAHALRAACDGVLVGSGTVLQDDPELTVRMVPGANPLRVVLDSRLRTPPTARVLAGDAGTVLLAASPIDPARRAGVESAGAAVRLVQPGPDGIDLTAALHLLRAMGVTSLLVEGGSRVITSLLSGGYVDRLIVSIAPTIIGAGVEAVGALGIARIQEGIRLVNRTAHLAGDDVLLGFDVAPLGAAADGIDGQPA